MSEGSVATLAEFIDVVKRLTAQPGRGYAFRGESSAGWPLFPGIMRDGFEHLWANERRATRDLVSVHPGEFQPDQTMFDRLVRMQHFGLPTRLLDVTLNPLVALFNASAPQVDKDGKPMDGKVYRFSLPYDCQKYYDSDTVSFVANLSNMSAEECNKLYSNQSFSFDDFNDIGRHKEVDRLVQFIRAEKPSF